MSLRKVFGSGLLMPTIARPVLHAAPLPIAHVVSPDALILTRFVCTATECTRTYGETDCKCGAHILEIV